ncbi:MAG: S9 family peptidase [Candidatus Krumholzibacteriia bacterium]
MRRIPTIAFAALAASLLAALGAGPAVAAGITAAQLLDLEQVRGADVAPDGKLAAFTVGANRSRDDEAGGPWSRLWVVATDGGTPRPFVTGGVTVGRPAFSPDGRFVGFTMSRGKDAKTQVWAIAVDGGEAQPVTASPTGVAAWGWSADGAAVLYVDTEEAPADEKTLKDKGWLPRFYEENLRGRTLRRTPFAFGQEPAAADTLVAGMSVWSLDVSADGRTVAFGASDLNLVDHQYMFQDIHVLDLRSGEHRLAVDVPGKLGDFKVSPDGRRLAWTAAASRSDHAVSSLFLGAIDGAQQTNITPDGFAGHIRNVAWRDAKTLLVQADEGVHTAAYLVDVGGKEPRFRRVLDGGDLGVVFGMPAARAGTSTMVMTGQSGAMPAELFAWSGKGAPRRLTHHNPVLAEVELGEQRVVRWNARDGLELEGILMLPVGWDGKPAPLIVDVHGGPESHERDGWLSRYASPGQAMGAKGYAVFFPNYRGSTGRGVAFAALAFGQPAGPEFDDIVDGVDHLVAEGIADKDRVGVMGGSYGGYATNWLVTRYSDRFKAGVGFVGVSDLVSKRFLTDIPYEDEYVHMGAPVRETWDLMRERSPVFHAENSRTPLLLLHGDSDPRVHPSQSQELYRALKMAGHPSVRLVYYPGEGHGNAKRFGREDALHRTMAWFDHYLLDGAAWDGPMPELDLSGPLELLKKD